MADYGTLAVLALPLTEKRRADEALEWDEEKLGDLQ
jgi:hypothetical protein